MSTISTAEAGLFSVDTPSCGIKVVNRTFDQFLGRVPFVYIDGQGMTVASVDGSSLPSFAALVSDVGATPSAAFPTVSSAPIALQQYTAVLEVDSLVLSRYGSRRNILRALIDVKVASLLELFRQTVMSADLPALGAVNNISANGGAGGAVQTGEIEAMLALLSPGEDVSSRYLVMSANALQHLRAGAYQNEVYFLQHPELGPLPTIGGVPVLISNFLPNTLGNTTEIYGVVFDADTGLFGVLPCAHRGREIRVLGPIPKEGTDQVVFHLHMQAGVNSANSKAVARLDQVQL